MTNHRSLEERIMRYTAFLGLFVIIVVFVLRAPRKGSDPYEEEVVVVAEYPSPDYWKTTLFSSRRALAQELLTKVYLEKDLSTIKPSSSAEIPEEIVARLLTEDAGIREANQLLYLLHLDTIPHQGGTFTQRADYFATLPMKDLTRHLNGSAADRVPRSVKYTRIKSRLHERMQDLKRNGQKAEEKYERPNRRFNPNQVLSKDAYFKSKYKGAIQLILADSARNYLGAKAEIRDNYELRPINYERDKAPKPFVKVEVALDDQSSSALLVWQDTFGIRQFRIPATPYLPPQVKVARGHLPALENSYLVSGRYWSDSLVSPWGAMGWFREVDGYFPPTQHTTFINGQQTDEAKLWVPVTPLKEQSGVSSDAFINMIRQL